MRAYELLVIADGDLEENNVEATVRRVQDQVKAKGGDVRKTERWGKRRFAYEIDKKPEGIYAVVKLSAEPATVKELDRQLTLNESVLRTKVMRPDAH